MILDIILGGSIFFGLIAGTGMLRAGGDIIDALKAAGLAAVLWPLFPIFAAMVIAGDAISEDDE